MNKIEIGLIIAIIGILFYIGGLVYYEMVVELENNPDKSLPKRLKYKIIDKQGRVVHHSFNKRNAERWIRSYDSKKRYKIRKL